VLALGVKNVRGRKGASGRKDVVVRACAIGMAAMVGCSPSQPSRATVVAPATEPARASLASLPLAADDAPASADAGPGQKEPVLPPAPPKIAVDGTAAVVWIGDERASFGFRSVYVVSANGSAQLVGERKEPVLVGAGELWILKTRKITSQACAECERCFETPPACRKNDTLTLQEPYLQALGAKRILEPWRGAIASRSGCKESIGDHGAELSLEGGVGSYYFATLRADTMFCGGAHPMFEETAFTLDIDGGREAELRFSPDATPFLQRTAHTELVEAGCVLDANDSAAPYRATAEYGSAGELRGVFSFTMPAPYMCGTGPGHYSVLSEQRSDFIPPELEKWGKLPDWLAPYMAGAGAKYAFVIATARAATARRAFSGR
jgi:hypothetical protein